MKSIDQAFRGSLSKTKSSMLDRLAKRVILSMLNKVQRGRLTIEDGGETFIYGQDVANTDLIAHIQVHHHRAYRQVLFGGTVGSGEAYMAGAWSSPDTTQVVRFFLLNKTRLKNMNSPWSGLKRFIGNLGERTRINSKVGSRRNIAAHYDLNNDFFSLFLDPTMMYSSAIYPSKSAGLDEAAVFKLQHICERLDLKESDHLLEIGTGWGGMAIHAAKHFGCKVTTTTISSEQYDFACREVARQGLSDRITLLKEDYRDLSGRFDKLVSVEMIEAVGHQYYDQFFAQCSHLLKPNGLMLIQAITTQDQRYEAEKNNVDFIRRYIFPGGCLPSNTAIAQAVTDHTDFHIVGLEDITLDYARTLAEWKRRFFAKQEEVKQLGFDDVFIRMWDFYLSFCEGGFAQRVINTSQFLMAKPECQALPQIR